MNRNTEVFRGPVFKGFLVFVLSLIGFVPLRAEVRIVAVRSSALPVYDEAIKGFRQSISSAKESPVISVETLPNPGADEDALLRSIDQRKPAVVLALGTRAATVARRSIISAPVVYCMVLEPSGILGYGGVSVDVSFSQIVAETRSSLNGVNKVGLVYNPSFSQSVTEQVKAMESKGLMVGFPAKSPAEADQALGGMKGKVDALLLLPDPQLFPPQVLGPFLKKSIEMRLPVIGFSPPFVNAGATAAFYADFSDNGALAAGLALRVIRGENLKSLPVLPPGKLKASFNLVIANHIGQGVDSRALVGADEVVK